MIINLGTLLSELQINFGVLQTDTENSATGSIGKGAPLDVGELGSNLGSGHFSFCWYLII